MIQTPPKDVEELLRIADLLCLKIHLFAGDNYLVDFLFGCKIETYLFKAWFLRLVGLSQSNLSVCDWPLEAHVISAICICC